MSRVTDPPFSLTLAEETLNWMVGCSSEISVPGLFGPSVGAAWPGHPVIVGVESVSVKVLFDSVTESLMSVTSNVLSAGSASFQVKT